MIKESSKPSFGLAFGFLLFMIALLIGGVLLSSVSLHSLLLIILTTAVIITIKLGYSFEEIIKTMGETIAGIMGALLIFLLIGALIGSWIHCGAVPALIYYGLKILSPKFFLPAGLIICSITSLVTGTSWGTCGTMGIAMMGIGTSMGVPAPIVAGMVISGAFFGDKMSPISDSTNLAAVCAGSDLYDHIRAMLYTTVPTYIICLGLYTFMGFSYAGSAIDTARIAEIQNVLVNHFNLNILVLIPMVVLLAMSLMKVPAVPSMVVGIFLGTLTSVIFQGTGLVSALNAINFGYSEATSYELVDSLILRGGMQSMMYTFSVAVLALSLGGVLKKYGYLEVLVENTVHKVKSIANMITVTIFSCILTYATTGEGYMTMVLNGSIYQDEFDKRGLKRSMLSRLIEEGTTITGALIPWTTSAVFCAATLGVSTLEYAPYAFLNYLNPLVSIVFTYMGIAILRNKDKNANIQSDIKG